jgi:hypothetical protein
VCTKSNDGLANAAKELSFHLFWGLDPENA